MPDTPRLTTVESRIINQSFTIEIPSEFEWINRTVSYLEHRARGIPWGDSININRVTLPLHEALTNAIVHGNLEVSSELKEEESDLFTETLAVRSTQSIYASRRVQIAVSFNAHRISWSITDEGNGFDVESVLRKATSEEPSMLASGRGVMMIKAFMDDVRYDKGGRRVSMTLRNPDVEQVVGLSSQDWDDLQQCFHPQHESFDADSIEVTTSPQTDRKLNKALEPLLATLVHNEHEDLELREFERRPYTGQIMTFEKGRVPRPGYARNISQGGLCFLCRSPFTSRQITVEVKVDQQIARIDSEIVRCTELIPNVYDIGIRFLRIST